jgi:hypothetical protein
MTAEQRAVRLLERNASTDWFGKLCGKKLLDFGMSIGSVYSCFEIYAS